MRHFTIVNETDVLIERVYIKINIYPYADDSQVSLMII